MALQPTKVLVVDDSALIRKILPKMLNSSPSLEVVAVAKDAVDAREKIKKYQPDVITLDIEMPGMDGIEFLKKIMQLRPLPVVMVSSLTQQGADITLQALSIGAVDFVAKPLADIATGLENYAQEIIEKVERAANVNVGQFLADYNVEPVVEENSTDKNFPKSKRIVAIGASTGGVVALEKIIMRLPKSAPAIVIAQHIPPIFSEAFASRLNKKARVEIREAKHGDEVEQGVVLIAPGDYHMEIVPERGSYIVELHGKEKVSGHRPSVDVLFRSVLNCKKKDTLAILLTGMGHDGAKGLKQLFDSGVSTIAQDESSSLIWGMPKRAIEIGAATQVVHLDDMHNKILQT